MFSKPSLIWSLVAQHSFPNYSITSILHSLLSFAFSAFLFVSIPIKPNPSSPKHSPNHSGFSLILTVSSALGQWEQALWSTTLYCHVIAVSSEAVGLLANRNFTLKNLCTPSWYHFIQHQTVGELMCEHIFSFNEGQTSSTNSKQFF